MANLPSAIAREKKAADSPMRSKIAALEAQAVKVRPAASMT